jgi:hypothetical protein
LKICEIKWSWPLSRYIRRIFLWRMRHDENPELVYRVSRSEFEPGTSRTSRNVKQTNEKFGFQFPSCKNKSEDRLSILECPVLCFRRFFKDVSSACISWG